MQSHQLKRLVENVERRWFGGGKLKADGVRDRLPRPNCPWKGGIGGEQPIVRAVVCCQGDVAFVD